MAGIELQGDANLTLVVDGTFTVTGGKAGDGIYSQSDGSGKGHGGYAGIAVPNGTTLSVYGSGRLVARGGDAGHGGDQTAANIDFGGSGGGGAGAGIGGNGGDGGGNVDSFGCAPGVAGGNAGTIRLYDRVLVEAYGGGGGSGRVTATTSGGGGGGYPAAGIGGGGAGGGSGSTAPGGGGFSGGGGEQTGMGGTNGSKGGTSTFGGGGGYFSAETIKTAVNTYSQDGGGIGGQGSYCFTISNGNMGHSGGDGGAGGAGGAVTLSSVVAANIKVANGSYISTTTKQWGSNPTPIYMQSGFKLDMIRGKGVTSVSARTGAALTQELKNKSVPQSVQPFSYDGKEIYGVGSGAGYTETSNGSCYRV